MKRAFKDDHQFDEDAMPCLCSVCHGMFDLDDGAPNPRNDREIICEGCADDIEKEIEREDEIDELKSQIEDAKITIKNCYKRLGELDYHDPLPIKSVCAKCGGTGFYVPSKTFPDQKIACECQQIFPEAQ